MAPLRVRLFNLGCCLLLSHFPRLFYAQIPLDTSLPNYVDVYKTIDFAVIGQQKSGTSTLWNILTANPVIKGVGFSKEMFWFNHEFPRSTLCDNHIEEYLRHVAMQRQNAKRTDMLIGDWTATYFSCLCCPVSLKMLNPKLKMVLVLRDPVQRVLSRFLEQKRSTNMPFHGQVKNYTFAEYTRKQLDELEACLARVKPFKDDGRYATGAGATGPGGFVGWGAGLDLASWMELQCYARENMFGWSAYDKFLANYLAHFPKEQLLVLYTDDLAADRLAAIRSVEKFIGAPMHNYDQTQLSLVYNSRECYSWRCGKRQNEIRPATELKDGAAQEDGPFIQALTRLRSFYQPHVQQLIRWSDQGIIAPVPDTWRKIYNQAVQE